MRFSYENVDNYGGNGGSGGRVGNDDVKYIAGSLGDIQQRMQDLQKERLNIVDMDDLRRIDETLVRLEHLHHRSAVRLGNSKPHSILIARRHATLLCGLFNTARKAKQQS